DYFANALAVPDHHMEVLPVMTAGDIVLPPDMRHTPQLVSVFSLDAWQRKGLDILAKAMTFVAQDIPGRDARSLRRGQRALACRRRKRAAQDRRRAPDPAERPAAA
ncbi:MAG: hypothetical protein K8F62_05580, partial [Pseudorhodoplanes sp.]|nr:hypothetical protein [Pseudorhodoplanes sp.]